MSSAAPIPPPQAKVGMTTDQPFVAAYAAVEITPPTMRTTPTTMAPVAPAARRIREDVQCEDGEHDRRANRQGNRENEPGPARVAYVTARRLDVVVRRSGQDR